jgi:hypothetical protein
MSDDFVVPRAVDSDLAVKLKDTGKSVQWHLDRTQMSPWIPCSAALALPPGFASAAFGTSDSKLTPSEIAQFLEAATVFFGVTNDHNGRIGGKALGNLCSNCAARPY